MKIKKIPKALIFLLLLICITEIVWKMIPGYTSLQEKGVIKIACYGDCFTGVGEFNENMWPEKLNRLLDKKFGEGRVNVVNYGRSACNSSMVLHQFKNHYKYVKPDIVIIMTGPGSRKAMQKLLIDRLNFGFAARRENTDIVIRNVSRAIEEFLGGVEIRKTASIKKRRTQVYEKWDTYVKEQIFKANVLRDSGRFMEAENIYKQILKINTDSPLFLLEYARCNRLSKDYDRAIELLISALAIDAGNKAVQEELKDVLIKKADIKKQVEVYKYLYKKFPETKAIKDRYKESLYIGILEAFQAKDYDNTISYYWQLFPLEPKLEHKYAQVYFNRAVKLRSQMANFRKKDNKKLLLEKICGSWLSFIKSDLIYEGIFYSNLKIIADICKHNNIILVLSGYPLETSRLMKDMAQKHDILIIDHKDRFNKLLEDDPVEKYFTDKLRLKEEGHTVAARSFFDSLEFIVEKRLKQSKALH